MTGREIYDVMEQLNPTKQQEEQMYQNILSSSAGKEYIENRGRKKVDSNRRVMRHESKLRYAAAVILLLVLAPTITYGAFHSAFLEKFFDINQEGKNTQDEEWLNQYVKKELATFSYGGYLFRLRGYLMNSQIGEGMLIIDAERKKKTDYRLWLMPDKDEKLSETNSFSSLDLSEDKDFTIEDFSKLIQFRPDGGSEAGEYDYQCWKTGSDSYEYRITFYSDYETVTENMQQPEQDRERPISLNFYDGRGELIGKMPLNEGNEFTVYHWLSPSGQNNVVLTPFVLYATGVPGQLMGQESKVIVTYRDGRKKGVEVLPLTGSYGGTYGKTVTCKLNNVVNTSEVESITIHTKDRDWYLDVENAQ